MMGAEIALCFAMAGNEVTMKDATLELAQKGKNRLEGVLDKAIQKGNIFYRMLQGSVVTKAKPYWRLVGRETPDCPLYIGST
jgi:3-hydroxyacyl-CoA dehydrogenase